MGAKTSSNVRVRVTTGVLIVTVFVSGAVVGGGLLRVFGEPKTPTPGTLGPPLSELGLSAEQTNKALKVRESYRPQIEAVVNEMMPRVREINERVETDVRAFLSEEQRRRLDELKKSRRPPPLPMPPPPSASDESIPGGNP